MNRPVYFRLLQPARTVPFVVFFTAAPVLIEQVLFKLTWPRETRFVVSAITLPLLLAAKKTPR